MKLKSKIILSSIFLAGTLPFLFASCDNRADEQDIEELTWMYLYANRPKELISICVENYTIAFTCMDETGIPGASEYLVSLLESVYTISVPPPRDEAALCSMLTESENFPVPGGLENNDGETITFSVGAKACILDCSGEFWQETIDAGDCTYENLSTIAFPSSDTDEESTYNKCFEDCIYKGTVL